MRSAYKIGRCILLRHLCGYSIAVVCVLLLTSCGASVLGGGEEYQVQGLKVIVPAGWTSVVFPIETGLQGLMVRRIVGDTSVMVSRYPGGYEEQLSVLQEQEGTGAAAFSSQEVVEWEGWHGKGMRFVRNDGSDERVILRGAGDLSEWYLLVVVARDDRRAWSECSHVVQSISLTK